MVERDDEDAARLRIAVPIRVQLRGGRTWVIRGAAPTARRDPVLIKALRRAHAMLSAGQDRRRVLLASPPSPYLRQMVKLAFLAPDLQRDILAGRQPFGLTLEQLIHSNLPDCWAKQRRGSWVGNSHALSDWSLPVICARVPVTARYIA